MSSPILVACESCKASAGEAHKPDCVESDAGRRRRHVVQTIVIDGQPVTFRASRVADGWRVSWEGFGLASDEMPVDGLAEFRFPNADVALGSAFANLQPVLRARRGGQ